MRAHRSRCCVTTLKGPKIGPSRNCIVEPNDVSSGLHWHVVSSDLVQGMVTLSRQILILSNLEASSHSLESPMRFLIHRSSGTSPVTDRGDGGEGCSFQDMYLPLGRSEAVQAGIQTPFSCLSVISCQISPTDLNGVAHTGELHGPCFRRNPPPRLRV